MIDEYYAVTYKDKVACYLNPALVERQNLLEVDVYNIKSLHIDRLAIEDEMMDTDDKELLKALAKDWTNVQFLMQDAWGFARDSNYHRWWTLPKCKCASMDNDDAYPSGQYWYSSECPIHGD